MQFTNPSSRKKILLVTQILLFLGSFQFLLLSTLAMIYYTGGSAWNRDARGYDFFRNCFSDLGMIITYGEVPNYVSANLFNLSLIIAGAFILFFWIINFLLTEKNSVKSYVSLVCGVLNGLSFIGIGKFTIFDQEKMHNIFVGIWLVSTLIILGFDYAYRNKELLSPFEVKFNLAFELLIVFFLIVLILIWEFDVEGTIVPALQKIVVYAQILWMLGKLKTLAISKI